MPHQLLLDKEGPACTQAAPEPLERHPVSHFWLPLRQPFVRSLKESEGGFQVRARLARPRETRSQRHTAKPAQPAFLPRRGPERMPVSVVDLNSPAVASWVSHPAFRKQMETPR